MCISINLLMKLYVPGKYSDYVAWFILLVFILFSSLYKSREFTRNNPSSYSVLFRSVKQVLLKFTMKIESELVYIGEHHMVSNL